MNSEIIIKLFDFVQDDKGYLGLLFLTLIFGVGYIFEIERKIRWKKKYYKLLGKHKK